MDLLRAAYLLETELNQLDHLPSWRRRDFQNVAHAAIRALRDAAERIEQLEAAQRSARVSHLPLHQPR